MRRRVDPEQLAHWYRLHWEAEWGEPVADSSIPDFEALRRRFDAWKHNLDRVAEALRDPLQPGAAKVIKRYVVPSDEFVEDLWRIEEVAEAIMTRGDRRKLAAIAQQRAEGQQKRTTDAAVRDATRTPETVQKTLIYCAGVFGSTLAKESLESDEATRREAVKMFARCLGVELPKDAEGSRG